MKFRTLFWSISMLLIFTADPSVYAQQNNELFGIAVTIEAVDDIDLAAYDRFFDAIPDEWLATNAEQAHYNLKATPSVSTQTCSYSNFPDIVIARFSVEIILVDRVSGDQLDQREFTARGLSCPSNINGATSSIPNPQELTFWLVSNLSADETLAGINSYSVLDGSDTVSFSNEGGVVTRGQMFSPDGRLVVAAGYNDDTLHIWDAHSGTEILALDTGTRVFDAGFSPDGQFLVAALSEGDVVAIYDANTRERVRTLEGHESLVTSVSFSHDGQTIVSTSRDNTVRLWDVATGENFATLSIELRPYHAAFSHDDQLIAVTTHDGMVKVWNRDGEVIQTFEFWFEYVDYVDFSPDGTQLVSVHNRPVLGIAVVWDLESGEQLHELKEHTSQIQNANYSPNGEFIVTSGDTTARIWDSQTGEQVLILWAGKGTDYAEFSPDGRFIATVSFGDSIQIWDVFGDN